MKDEVLSQPLSPATDVPDDQTPPLEGDAVESSLTPFDGDLMEVTVQVAEHLEKYEKALNAILNFIIKRSYNGDWVSHDKAGTPPEERVVNMSGACAERIARDLGVNEKNRTKPEKIWDDKHPGHYAYRCEGDFSFRGRTVHAIGMATTLNPFYSKAGGQMRNPDDIREEYILRDAWRDATKQGVKGLFGLRKIPLLKLQELGYDIARVKYVNFQSSDGSQAAKNPSATAKPKTEATFETVTTVFVDFKKDTPKEGCQKFLDEKNVEFSLWRPALHEDAQRLFVAVGNHEQVTIEIRFDGRYRQIQKIVEVVSR